MNYSFVKFLHVLCATTLFAAYVLRLIWMIADTPRSEHRGMALLPWIGDAFLVGTGIWMLLNLANVPGTDVWMIGKILLMIIFGSLTAFTLYFIRSQAVRVAVWIGALVVYLQIVVISILKDPLGMFALGRWVG